jgi:hypothetical protein
MTTHEFLNPGCGDLNFLVLFQRGLNEVIQNRILKLLPPCGIATSLPSSSEIAAALLSSFSHTL